MATNQTLNAGTMNRENEAIERVNHALERVGREMEASECHGLVTGLICARGEFSEADWTAYITAESDPADVLAQEARAVFGALHSETERQLASSVLDFHPLLPADGEALDTRVIALSEWVQGFLLGLAEGGVKDLDKLPADSAEVVRDFAQIAGAGGYEFEEGEDDEEAYAQLLEYVRTGVLLVNEELNPTKAPPRGDITLH